MDDTLRPKGLRDRLRQMPSPTVPNHRSDAVIARVQRVASSTHALPGFSRRVAWFSVGLFTRWLWCNGLVTALYFGSALAGNALKLTGNVDGVWPPAGVGIAAVYLGGLRLLPGVLAGDILADLPHSLPLGASIGQTCGNMLEVAVGGMLIRRLVRTGSPLDRVDGLVRLFIAVVAGTAISATVGPLSLLRAGAITNDQLASVARTWFIGDTCGALVVVPLVLAWFVPRFHPLTERRVEALLALAGTVSLCELGLHLQERGPVMYLVFPALIWAALRFGARGGTTAVAVTVTLTIWATAHERGPFAVHSITDEVLGIQLFVAAAAISTLVLAAIANEREQFAARLSASRIRMVEAANAERRRLERDLHDGAQQRLTALTMRLNDLRAAPPPTVEETADFLRHANDELLQAVAELRELAHGIHPAVLTDFGLRRAAECMALRSNIPVRVVSQLPPHRLDETVESTAYYVIAESLANAQRHAHCSSIVLRIALIGDVLHVRIADNGVGGAREAPGSGLEGLRDRVESVGGTFIVLSAPTRGTHIHAAIPVTAVASGVPDAASADPWP